jgi:hypothetical protein
MDLGGGFGDEESRIEENNPDRIEIGDLSHNPVGLNPYPNQRLV